MMTKPKITNIKQATGDDLIYLRDHKCSSHGHRYTSHFNCFLKEQDIKERLGFLDIESGGSLTADFGYTLSYCIKELDGKVYRRVITPTEVRNGSVRDKPLLQQFLKDVRNFDTLVVYYGKDSGGRFNRHDIPFMRTRCLHWKLEGFPKDGELHIIDLYDVVKGKLKLANNKMVSACRILGIESKTSPIVPDIWQDALAGNLSALKYILKHNIEDVYSTEELFKQIYMYKATRSKI
jgi:uncharacterized protein YprB with RNaseH-like and TPR domain